MNSVHVDSLNVAQALAKIGLEEEPLLAAVKQGYLARINATPNHPPLYPSFVAWAETVRALRDYGATLGWTRSDANNYSRIFDPLGRIAIAVATGDEWTGNPSVSPSTKASKGPSTAAAVEVNQAQDWLFPEFSLPPAQDQTTEDQVVTWILLISRSASEMRCELSRPASMGSDNRVNGWQERILLRSIPLDPQELEVIPPTQPDLEIEVRRKA